MSTKTKEVFLDFLHSFRAFAIISIVAGHAVSAFFLAVYHKYVWSDPILIINELVFNQCTLYFALISGLLFSAVLSGKSYKKFYTNRILFVFLPYLFFTLLYTTVKFQRYNFIYVDIDRIDLLWRNLFGNLLFGGANFVLWYMPVLFGLYILTPVFNFLFKKQASILIWIIILFPLISSGIKIPIMYGQVIGKIIYFSGAYVLGMYLGSNMEYSFTWIKDRLIYILVTVAVSTIVLAYLHFYKVNNFEGIYLQDSFFYVQKICSALALIVFFKQLGTKQPAWLTKVAIYSTPIYFIHGAIVFSCASLFLFIRGDEKYTAFYIFVGAIVLTIFTIVVSMFIAYIIKKLFGKNSRMIIGT